LVRKDRLPKGKVALSVLIDKEVYELLVKMAPKLAGKGKYRGALSTVVERALRRYLRLKAGVRIPSATPRQKVVEVYIFVKMKLAEITGKPYHELKECTESDLDRAIGEVRGIDPRTIKKWKQLFLENGLIRYLGGTEPDRLMELMP